MVSPTADADFLSAISREVAEHWKQFHEPLLLSRLGQNLARRGFDVQARLAGIRLSEVIRNHLADELRLQPTSPDSKVWAAMPADTGAVVAPKLVLKPDEKQHLPRVAAHVWAAFVRPLPVGSVREIELGDEPVFRDLPIDEASSGSLLVTSTDVIQRSSEEEAAPYYRRVYQSICAWAEANSIPIERVRADAQPSKRKPDRSLLEAMISQLTDDQRRRVNLPLDVVASLLKI